MKLIPTPLTGLHIIQHTPTSDARGKFARLFCEQEMATIRSHLHFTQINFSQTSLCGSLRGLHYQRPPTAEAKIVRCLHGRVFDVAVDLRAGSPTFLRWHGVELSDENAMALFIPEGFAHGFQTLTDQAHLLYMHTAPWAPECEAGLRFDDPRLAIHWPLPVGEVSERDRNHMLIDHAFRGVNV